MIAKGSVGICEKRGDEGTDCHGRKRPTGKRSARIRKAASRQRLRHRNDKIVALTRKEGASMIDGGALLLSCEIVGRGLVDEVVQPVGEQQVRVGTPCDERGLGVVVVGEVVLRNGDGQAERLVAVVFALER